MVIDKSTRHSKIAGDYFESQVLYNLSKYGFECSLVDHTGIDIIAKNPNSEKLWGISVKGRTRTEDRIGTSVTFDINNGKKARSASKAFNCDEVYFAICIDEDHSTTIFLLTLDHLLDTYTPKSQKQFSWNMSSAAIKKYMNDDKIKVLRFEENNERWEMENKG